MLSTGINRSSGLVFEPALQELIGVLGCLAVADLTGSDPIRDPTRDPVTMSAKFSDTTRTIKKVKKLGRCWWKKASGYHRQARVENAFFRYKSIIGEGLRARTPGGHVAEALLARATC